jgi:Do/DeqQ family serine protease
MDTTRFKFTRFERSIFRTPMVVLITALVTAGGTWRVMAESRQGSTTQVTTESPTSHPASVESVHTSYADVVRDVAPAVVTIRTEGKAQMTPTAFPDLEFFRRFFDDRFEQMPNQPRTYSQRGLGSGVVVSTDGYILTNHHVIAGADDIRVDLTDGRTLKGTVIGSDAPSDLALLKVPATDLHGLELGDSDRVQVGDVVLAIGNPLGVGQTVTMGIISAKGRSTGLGEGGYEDFLQTDAPINQGNSGGALVNAQGELVGINSQILSPSGGNIGIGFAIPVNMARHVMESLRRDGHVRRAQLGVTIQPLTADLSESLGLKQIEGAIVSSVTPGSPAERAGVKRGDVITVFNGQQVRDTNTLRNRVADAAPGSRSTLTVIRDGTEHRLNVELAEVAEADRRADDRRTATEDTTFGVSVAPLTPDRRTSAGLPSHIHGLVVEAVTPDSRAAAAGLQPGDVIEEVNRQPVSAVEQLRAAVNGGNGRPTLLLVNRDGKDLFLAARAS